MSISKNDLDRLHEAADQIESAMADITRIIQNADPHLYDRWKAYGKQVTSEFVSMGPNLFEIVEQLDRDANSEDDEDAFNPDEGDDNDSMTCMCDLDEETAQLPPQ
jgi:hypothetical protein